MTGSAILFGDDTCSAGETVVHIEHGLARHEGETRLEIAGDAQDLLELTYRNGGKLRLPAKEHDQLWRHGSDPDYVTLDKLDADDWITRRDNIVMELRETAKALQKMRRKRLNKTTAPFDGDREKLSHFASSFAHTETADQITAIDEVLADLRDEIPMDRLVIGDVGFGKTEVALRAIACAVFSGFQVAVGTPTTVLCRQHYETFVERLEPFGISVGELSRFSSVEQEDDVRKGMADGSIDVIVGTHKLTAKSLKFARLGLVIIDEEQKFGLKRKKKMRKLGRDINLLTMTATPIPKSLAAAEIGLCDVSILATPPSSRLPVDTQLTSTNVNSWLSALNREAERGGQTYVVCPKIKGLDEVAESVDHAFPDLRTGVVHGKLPKGEIEDIMLAFAKGEVDVLICTAVVESGLDVTNANTMVVFDPQDFGLAQLHQLRGRIGRSGRQAHMLLLVDDVADTTTTSGRRLELFCKASQLGAGFDISRHDYGMRGAGDLLGDEQTGHISVLGVGLYQHLLKQELTKIA